jgi:hypothetical protein
MRGADRLPRIAHLLNGRAGARRERERRDDDCQHSRAVGHGGFFNRP